MSDQFEEGTVEGQPEVQSDTPNTPSPTYLTKDEAEAYFKKMEETLMGRQANLMGKGTERLRERLAALENHVKLQRDTGMTVKDEDVERMRSRIITDSLLDQGEPAPQSAQVGAQQPAVQGVDPQRVNALAQNMLDKMGVTFGKSDPEIKMIKLNGSPEDYLDSLLTAATAWKERNSEKPNPEARIPGLVSGSTSEKDLKAAYEKDLKAAQSDPFNAKEKALQIRRKYRGLGLPV